MTFDQALVACMPQLRLYASFLTRRRAAADDLVQATFERALRKRHLYREVPGKTFGGWLTTMMRNLHTDVGRRSHLEPVLFAEPPERAVPAGQETAVMLREVKAEYDHLPRRHRDLLELVALHGCTYAEAGRRLGLPLGTVRSRLYRARQDLTRRTA